MRQDQKENDQITKAAKHSPPLLVNLTSMPELSPAAEAVWEAFNEDEAGVFVDYGEKLAAALRAAAQLNPGPFVPELFGDGWEAAMGELLTLADELEAQ